MLARRDMIGLLFSGIGRQAPSLPQGPAVIREHTRVIVVSQSRPDFQIPHPDYVPESFQVFRNGLLQYSPGDYTVSGSTVSFVSGTPTPVSGDVLVFRYRTP